MKQLWKRTLSLALCLVLTAQIAAAATAERMPLLPASSMEENIWQTEGTEAPVTEEPEETPVTDETAEQTGVDAEPVEEETPVEQRSLSLTVGGDATEMNFTWYADTAVPGGVRLAKYAELVDGSMPEDAETFPAETMETGVDGFTSHQATATGLKPGTEYAYQLVNGETASPIYTFTTDGGEEGFSFAYAGDPQIGAGNTTTDTETWEETLDIVANSEEFEGVDFLFSAGDQVNGAGNESQYDGYLNHEPLYSLPVAPVIGNHDSASAAHDQHFNVPNESDLGVTPSGGDYYYVYENTLFMVLNSNNLSTAEHRQFMIDTINDTADLDIKWKVVEFHHSIYSVASHAVESDILQRRSALVPVFESLGVDVVLMGHDHVYVRTYMMDGLTPITDAGFYTDDNGDGIPDSATDPNGILYVTANSASGSKYYEMQSQSFPYAAVKNQEHTPNISRVDITDNTFTVTTYRTKDMSVVDTFTIRRTEDTNTGSTKLESLNLSGASLSPVFDRDTTSYTAQLGDEWQLGLFAQPEDRDAEILVNGEKLEGFTTTVDTTKLSASKIEIQVINGEAQTTYTIELEQTYFIQPESATAGSSWNTSRQNPNNIINNSGMSDSGAPMTLTATHDNEGSALTMWHTGYAPGENAWIQIDLGDIYALDQMYVWNMNQSGYSTSRSMKNAKIEYSEDGVSWNTLAAPEGIQYEDGDAPEEYPFQFAPASGSANESISNLNDGNHTPVSFGGIKARYVKITAHPDVGVGNYDTSGNASRSIVGLAEVRFTYQPDLVESGTAKITGAEQTYYIKEAGQESKLSVNAGTPGTYYLRAAVTANEPAENAAYPNPEGVAADPIVTEVKLMRGPQTITVLTPDTNAMLGPGNTATLTLQLFKDQACTEPFSEPLVISDWARTRHWEFYLSESMHTDIGYTAYQEDLRTSFANHLDNALNMVQADDDRPADQQFKYVVESAWTLGDGYLQTYDADRIAEFLQKVEDGDLSVSASEFNLTMENLSTEIAARAPYYTNRNLVDMLGIEPSTVIRSFDNPAFSKSYVDIAVSAGIKYGIHSMNTARSPYNQKRQHQLFYMVGNNPENKLLILNGEHYAKTYGFDAAYSDASVETALSNIGMLIERMEGYTGERTYYYDKYPLQLVGGGGDNGAPRGNQDEIANGINAKLADEGYTYPRVTCAFPEEFFEAVEAEYSVLIPEETGTEENWWNDGWSTSALDSGINKEASETLPVAETTASLANALLGAEYPYESLDEALDRILVYDEHTWGNAGWSGGSNTASGKLQSSWKRSNAYGADALANQVLDDSLESLASQAGSEGKAIYVYNQLNWSRSDVVTVDDLTGFPEHFVIMDGEASIPYAVEDGVLTFIAPDVPAMGYKTFTVETVDSEPSFTAQVTTGENFIENAYYKVLFNADGTISSILDKQNGGRELVDQDTSDAAGEKFNQYRYYQTSGEVLHTPEETGGQLEITSDGISATARLDTSAFRASSIVQTVTLYNDIPRIDITNEVVKEPHDSYGEREEAYYTFPFNVEEGDYTIHYDLPVGNTTEGAQITGTSHAWYTVNKWVSVQNGVYNMVLATPNTSNMEFGERRTGEDTQWDFEYVSERPYLYSYVMNNQWTTNYPDDQPGYADFRYSISTNTNGTDMSGNNRFGLEISTPLQAAVIDEAQPGDTSDTYIGISAENVQVSTMKSAEANGEGMILRFAESDGKDTQDVTVTLPYNATITETDIIENDLGEAKTGSTFTFTIPAYGFKTFRIVKNDTAVTQVQNVKAVTPGSGEERRNLSLDSTATASNAYDNRFVADNAKVIGDGKDWAYRSSADSERWLELAWDTPQQVGQILIADRVTAAEYAKDVKVILYNGDEIIYEQDGVTLPATLILDEVKSVTKIRVEHHLAAGGNGGLDGVEVYTTQEPISKDVAGTQITWDAVPNAAYYQIFRSTDPGFTPGSGNWLGSTSGLSFFDGQVTAEVKQDYYYSVRAVGAGAAGPCSAVVGTENGSILDEANPGEPTLSAIRRRTTQIDLYWTPVADNIGVDHYEIFRDGNLIYTTPDAYLCSYLDEGLTEGTDYVYRVDAVDASGNRTQSRTLTVSPLGKEPDPVRDVLRLDGDSFGRGGYGEEKKFVDIVAEAYDLKVDNKAVSSSIINDGWKRMLNDPSYMLEVPSSYDYHLINLGFNDMRKYGNDPLAAAEVANRLQAMISYMRLGSIMDQDDATITYTGSWTTNPNKDDMYGGGCTYTGAPGDSLTTTFTGGTLTIGTFGLETNGGTMEILVDGTSVRTVDLTAQCTAGYAPMAIELSGLGDGRHTLTIRKADDTQGAYIYLDYIGQRSDDVPTILVNGITRMKEESYHAFPGWNNGSDEAVTACNEAIERMITENFDETVLFVDQSDYDPNQLVGGDGVHPSTEGHQWIAQNIIDCLNGMLPPMIPVTDITEVPTETVAGTSLVLSGQVIPSDATNQDIIWSVKDAGTTGAVVNGAVLDTVAAGTVVITATIPNGVEEGKDFSKDFTITVKSDEPSEVPVTGVELDRERISLHIGETQSLSAKVYPEDATNQNVTWSSSNESVAAVSTTGVVTAAAEGTATITVTTEDGNLTDTCLVTVLRQSSGGGGGNDNSGVTRYTITAKAGEGGRISPNGSMRVERGEDQSFTITADEGYHIDDVLVDGESVGTVSSYTFENVRRAHTIEAVFTTDIGEGETPLGDLPFTDVDETAWYAEAVTYVVGEDLMNGTSATTFAPGQTLTRSMMAQILYNLAGQPAVEGSAAFTDVAAGAWYADAVAWAAGSGIVKGYSAAAFGPEDAVTREQLAVMLYQYAQYQKYDVSGSLSGSLSGFADGANTSSWAVEAVEWAVQNGLLSGKDGSRLDPTGTATRAEVAAILMRFCENIGK